MNLFSILPAPDAAQQPRDGVLLAYLGDRLIASVARVADGPSSVIVGFGANSLQHLADDIRGGRRAGGAVMGVDAREWSLILDSTEANIVHTTYGELVAESPDPCCVKCGTRCARCSSALTPGYRSILRDDAAVPR